MVTDWILIRRAAAELDGTLRGGRIVDAGLLDDGRFALRIGGRARGRAETVLAVDVFGSPPLVTLETDELSIAGDPSWARAIVTAVRGMRIAGVRSRPGDRVLLIAAGTTSRFGVGNALELIFELVPRFGNALLLRDGNVIAAAKQFSPAENETRSVTVGGAYRPPPLPGGVRLPRLLAEAGGERPEALLAEAVSAAETLGPIHVYRERGRLVAAHVVPLPQFAALEHALADRLLPLLAESRQTSAGRRTSDAVERRRTALTGRIAKRLTDVGTELAQIDLRRADAAGRERLRAAGDALHTYGSEIPERATSFRAPGDPPFEIALDPELDVKANAARYFARYRKAADALPHLERRLTLLGAKRDSLEALAFETERADPATLGEIAASLDELEGHKPAVRRARSAPRPPLRFDRPSGARIYVGRSPRENVDITFRLARPDDLWFHARGIPGSHVVLQTPPGQSPHEDDLALAADLAAQHSRARNAPRVEIDFTERKYVRKQRDASPGLVWYTNARTRVGRPDQLLA